MVRVALLLLLACAALAAPGVEVVRALPAGVHGLALGPDGALYFSDSFGHLAARRQVYRLRAPFQGAPERTGIEGALPAGLCWHEDRLFVCDTGANRVRVYDRSLRPLAEWPVTAPWNIRPLPTGSFWVVSYANQAHRLTRGLVVQTIHGLSAPFDLAVAASGELWISEQGVGQGAPGRVGRWSPAGRLIAALDYPWANPEGLALLPDGRLAIAETERGEVLLAGPDGRVSVLASGLGLPVVALEAGGALLVATSGADAKLLRIAAPRAKIRPIAK